MITCAITKHVIKPQKDGKNMVMIMKLINSWLIKIISCDHHVQWFIIQACFTWNFAWSLLGKLWSKGPFSFSYVCSLDIYETSRHIVTRYIGPIELALRNPQTKKRFQVSWASKFGRYHHIFIKNFVGPYTQACNSACLML